MQKSQAWPPRSQSQHFNKVIRTMQEFGKCRTPAAEQVCCQSTPVRPWDLGGPGESYLARNLNTCAATTLAHIRAPTPPPQAP